MFTPTRFTPPLTEDYKADIDVFLPLLEEAWRRHVARPFMVYNGLTGRAPRLGLQIAPEVAPKTFLECADLAANKLRLPLSASQIRRNTGLREPIDSADEVTGTPDPAPAPAAEAVP